MNEERTIDTILEDLEQMIREKKPISPKLFLDEAHFLNLLLGKENEELYMMKSLLAKEKAKIVVKGESVASATVHIEAMDEFLLYEIKKARVEQIKEMVRIAKAQSKLLTDEIRGY